MIKVFERSVDFGQFGDNAALYPMARAWIRNLNQGDKSAWNDVPNTDDERQVIILSSFIILQKACVYIILFFIFLDNRSTAGLSLCPTQT